MENLQTLRQYLGSEANMKRLALDRQAKIISASRQNPKNPLDKILASKKEMYKGMTSQELSVALAEKLWQETHENVPKDCYGFIVSICGCTAIDKVNPELLYEIVPENDYFIAKVKGGSTNLVTFSTIILECANGITVTIKDVFPGLPITLTRISKEQATNGTISGNACLKRGILTARCL